MNDSEPEIGKGLDADGEQLRRLLTDLADDPDAPETTVSGPAVIAAARAGAQRAGAVQRVPEAGPGTEPAVGPGGSSSGELHVLAVNADSARGRGQRRRRGLIALAAAASVAGIAAIVIPLSVNSGSTTSTAADSGVAGAMSGTDSAGTMAAASAAGAAGAAGGAEAAAQGQDSGQGRASAAPGSADAAGVTPAASGGAEAAGPERPPPGPDALTELMPADGVTPAPQEPAPTEPTAAPDSCWPALSDDAVAALTAALPAGSFGAPSTLTATCGPDPVGGAALVGTTPGTALVVRGSKAEEGACARGNSEAGVRCVPRGGGVYAATDSSGQAVAFAYGNGNEVVVSGPPVEPGAISTPKLSGLSADELVAAAQAVLAALG